MREFIYTLEGRNSESLRYRKEGVVSLGSRRLGGEHMVHAYIVRQTSMSIVGVPFSPLKIWRVELRRRGRKRQSQDLKLTEGKLTANFTN